IVAIVGDGALTGGMSWEALNDIAGANLPVTIIVNDNGRSYAPTVGGLPPHLGTLRAAGGYERFLAGVKYLLQDSSPLGALTYRTMHAVKAGLKDALVPHGPFDGLGLKYLGPVDGHDLGPLERVLELARHYPGPL